MRMSPAGITGLIAASAGLALASVLWAQPAPESGKAPAAAEKKPDFPGEIFAGLQMGEYYTYWKRIDKRLALVMPNVEFRSTGDRESKDSIQNHFTDRVLIDVPIECMGPNGQPMIDADDARRQQAGLLRPAWRQAPTPDRHDRRRQGVPQEHRALVQPARSRAACSRRSTTRSA
jgi:hypothetical protein